MEKHPTTPVNLMAVNLMDIKPQVICDWLELHEDCQVCRLSIDYLPSLTDGLKADRWIASLVFRNPSDPQAYGSANVYFDQSRIHIANIHGTKSQKPRAEKAFWVTMRLFYEKATKPIDLHFGESEYVNLPESWIKPEHPAIAALDRLADAYEESGNQLSQAMGAIADKLAEINSAPQ